MTWSLTLLKAEWTTQSAGFHPSFLHLYFESVSLCLLSVLVISSFCQQMSQDSLLLLFLSHTLK